MIRKFEKDKFSFFNRIKCQSLTTLFVLSTCVVVCLLAFVPQNVYLCEASKVQVYGKRDLHEDKRCTIGRESLALSAPSEISCFYHCSGQLQNIGIVYESDSGTCKCCSEIAEPKELLTGGKTKFYNISRSKDKPHNCGALVPNGASRSGIYTIYPNGLSAVEVFCDFDDSDGPWTVIQRRVDGTVNFYRPYKSYQDKFGNLSGNFWLGLDTISTLTLHSDKTYSLKVILVDTVEGVKFAKYSQFAVTNLSTGYTLNVQGYSGTAGDSLTYHHGCAFSTFDMDRDKTGFGNCALLNTGAWWYRACLVSCLNGKYEDRSRKGGILWQSTTGIFRSATFATMKLKENI